MADLEKGDEVTWNTSQGETHGRVVDVHNEDIELHDQTFRGSDDDPVYVVESNKSGTRAAHKASALSKAALTVDDDERRATYDEFREVVNMTPSELERWLDSEHSQEVGAKPDDGGESVGHRSGRRIVALLRARQGDLDDDDHAHMREVVGYVHRHLAQRPDGDVRDTRWRWSLMNWGHDPLQD